jgi:hypothetical protein
MAYSLEQAERVRGVLADRAAVTEKEMFGGIALLLAGNMAVGVRGQDVSPRLIPCHGGRGDSA